MTRYGHKLTVANDRSGVAYISGGTKQKLGQSCRVRKGEGRVMLEDRTLRNLCISILVAAAIACVATTLFGVAMSFGLGFPITLGLIVAGWSTAYDRNRLGRRWNRRVPAGLTAAFLIAIAAGIALAFFGFNMPSMASASGQPAHHINAYVEQGRCWAVFNKDAPIEMPVDFCASFNVHFGAAFSGGWLFLGGFVSSLARRRSSTSGR